MSNVVETLKRSKEAISVMMSDSYLRELFHLEDLMKEINDAIINPEIRVSVPKGEFVMGISTGESTQASVCLENDTLGMVDLLMAECVGEELREENESEGDIRLYTWGDISTEDYSIRHTIRAEEIDAQVEYLTEKE